MKTQKAALAICLVLLAILPNVLGDNGLNISESTKTEIRSMDSSYGAQMRLLQLEKSIDRNINVGNYTINAINQENQTADTSQLQAILVDMGNLKLQVSQVDPSGNLSESAMQFVELKSDAINLTQEFKTVADTIVSPDDLPRIRNESVSHENDSEISNFDGRIKLAANLYRADRLGKYMKQMEITDSEFLNNVSNGISNSTDIENFLSQKLDSLSNENRSVAIEKINEDISERSIRSIQVSEEVVTNFSERAYAREQARIDKIGDVKTKSILVRMGSEKIQSSVDSQIEDNTSTNVRIMSRSVVDIRVRGK